MEIDEEYWYIKGAEDFAQFLIDSTEEKNKDSTTRMTMAITNQLRRNIKLIKELNKKKK